MELSKRNISDIHLSMELAESASVRSKCVRSKVGAVILTKSGGMYAGVNGRLPGKDNVCEIELPNGELVTKPDTIHAEANTLDKMHREGIPAVGCIAIQTLSPCLNCLTRMINSGIKLVIYRDEYREMDHLKEYIQSGYVMSYSDFSKKYD